ncbi:hypothetical protein GALMADRAFT_217785 [Galerina marginata CBS 339.88]|uniref:Uncharacterized protein n=1 Tax=Galerina marginata (strain CBS 339.88) TaxID=685588 RepID=A0A067U065_GALM3|nr:hypothetical protein GALMADRAFT_217785 [Galerina marginata CBS 339.88]
MFFLVTESFINSNNTAIKPTDSSNRSTSPRRSVSPVRRDAPNKKKPKQKAGLVDDTGRLDDKLEKPVDLKSLMHYDKNSTSLLGDIRLFETLDAFFELVALHDRPRFPESAFLLATRRAVDALSVSLDFTVKKEMNLDRLGTFDILLRLIIEKALPVVALFPSNFFDDSGAGPFDALLNQLQTAILIPIIRAFLLISTKYLERSLGLANGNRGGAAEYPDGRPALLALFQSIIEASCATISSCSKSRLGKELNTARIQDENFSVELSIMVHSLILEATCHLDQILADRAAQIVDYTSERDHHRRVLRIAVKDTLWYLCSGLHILIAAQAKCDLLPDIDSSAACFGASNSKSTRLHLLKKTVLSYFVDVLSRQDRKRRMERDGSALTSYLQLDAPVSARPQIEQDTVWPFTPRTHVLLDGMEHRMLLRVVESYFNTQ